MGVTLTACGSGTKPVSSKVDCSKQAVQLKDATSAKEKADSKLKDVKGTPDEKQAKKDIEAAQATIDALNACPTPKADDKKHEVVVDVVRKALRQQGFKDDKIVTDPALITENTADPGHGVFGEMVSTPAEAVAFIGSGTPQAKDAIKAAKYATKDGCAPVTKAQLLDPSNWVAAQLNEMTSWGGNTYYHNGIKMAGSTKVDKAGTITMIFVPPGQIECGKVTSVFALRGACTNPQFDLPHPTTNCEKQGTCPKPKCIPYVPYEDRCVKPKGTNDPGGAGGNGSPAKQPVGENPQGPSNPSGTPRPTSRPTGDPDGGSGDGGAPTPTVPDDDSDSGQTTSPSPSATPSPCGVIPTC